MTNKMVSKNLLYAQGLPSFGDSEGTKLKKFMKKMVYPSLRLVYGNQVFSDATKNGTIFSRNLMVSKMAVKVLDSFMGL